MMVQQYQANVLMELMMMLQSGTVQVSIAVVYLQVAVYYMGLHIPKIL